MNYEYMLSKVLEKIKEAETNLLASIYSDIDKKE